MLLHMTEIISSALLKGPSPMTVQARQLEVDHPGKSIFTNHDVHLLVQVVVTDTTTMQLTDQPVQVIEEVHGKLPGMMQRLPANPLPHQDL